MLNWTENLLWNDKLRSKEKTYGGLFGGLEHLKIETRLIDEKIANSMGEYVTWLW
jgi:hypothetical protein